MRNVLRTAGAILLGAASAPCFAQRNEYRQNSLAPYVPSPQRVVDRMLQDAALKPGETLYDLGCGDGRVLITASQKFKAKAVGVEISPKLARTARENIKKANLETDVKVIEGNLMDVDVSPADVVIIYLLTQSNDMLRPKLEKSLRPGARVVSHDFKVPGWEASTVDKTEAFNRMHVIYVYQMPPRR